MSAVCAFTICEVNVFRRLSRGTRNRLFVGAAVATVMTLAACGSSATPGSEVSSTGAETSSAAASAKPYTVGIIDFSAADTSSMSIVNTFIKAAEAAGNTVLQVDAAGDPGAAISAIQNFITKKVDVIFTPVFGPDQLAAGLTAAKAAGIVVVGMVPTTGNGMPVTWDNSTLPGKLLGEQFIKDTGGTGRLLEITYSPGLPCQARLQGFKDALGTASVQFDLGELQVPDIIGSAEKITSAWLTKNPAGGSEKLYVYSCADSILPGILTALKSANRTDVKVYTMDGDKAGVDSLKAGGAVAAEVYVAMGPAGTEIAAQMPGIIAAGVDQSAHQIDVTSVLITAATVDQFLTDHPTL